MKRLLVLMMLVSFMLPAWAGAEKTTLRLLGVEEGPVKRGNDPEVRYEQVDFNIWGDPMVWLTKKNADVVYLNGRGVDLQTLLRQEGLLRDLSGSGILREHVGRMMPWAQELVSAEDGAIYALPVTAGLRCFSVRRDGWAAAGFAETEIPRSYEELLRFLERWCDRLEENPKQPARVCDLTYWNTGVASCNYGYWLMDLLLTSHAMQCRYAGEPLCFTSQEFIECAQRTRDVAKRLYTLEPRGNGAKKLPVMFRSGLNLGRPGNDDLDYELSCAVPMRLNNTQPPLMLVQTSVLVVPANAAEPEAAVCFLEEWVQSIPWFNRTELYSDFAPGQYEYEGGWPVLVSEGWLEDYHSWDGIYYCTTNVYGSSRTGVTGKEKEVLAFLKGQTTPARLAEELDKLLN